MDSPKSTLLLTGADQALQSLASSMINVQKGYRKALAVAVGNLGVNRQQAWALAMIKWHGDGLDQEKLDKLTDYWKEHDVKEGEEFAILTNIIHQEWAEVDEKAHKAIKGLKSQNLRDHMSEAELIFTALAELSTRQIAESIGAEGMNENKTAAKTGGGIAKKARLDLEGKTGRRVVSNESYLPPEKKKLANK